MPKQVAPRTRKAWRAWLSKNHDRTDEVWLVFFKQHAGGSTLTYNDAVEEALCFGWIDGIRKRVDERRYMHRMSPRKARSKWSPSNKVRAERLIAAGLMTAAGQRLIEAAKSTGAWGAVAQDMATLHPAFAAALRRNKRAGSFFKALAPGYQRLYRNWIGSAKREETRARRIAQAIKQLAAGKKPTM